MTTADKKAFYKRGDVVAAYDDWRFGSEGGRYVNARELDAVLGLLGPVPLDGRVLDLPCGTGRLTEKLVASGRTGVFGGDYSPGMLATTRERVPTAPVSRHDALRTGFATASFDAAVCLRFTFHTPDLGRLLRELARVVKPGGSVIVDTLRWSPRTIVPGLDARLGGTLWTWPDLTVRNAASAAGLEVDAVESMLLLPSFAYRFVPGAAVRGLDRVEKRLPTGALSKAIWRLRRLA